MPQLLLSGPSRLVFEIDQGTFEGTLFAFAASAVKHVHDCAAGAVKSRLQRSP